MENIIVERRLIAESKLDGTRKNVVIRVGTPHWVEEGVEAECPVEFEGLFENFSPRKGIDLLQSLNIASNVDLYLSALDNEYKFYWPNGDEY